MDGPAHVYLFLDDERSPRDVTWIDIPYRHWAGRWTIVRDYPAFVAHVERHGLPTHISFDHDLGPLSYQALPAALERQAAGLPHRFYEGLTEKTGMDCAKWLVQYCLDHGSLPLPAYTIHSMNPIGVANIKGLLESYTNTIILP